MEKDANDLGGRTGFASPIVDELTRQMAPMIEGKEKSRAPMAAQPSSVRTRRDAQLIAIEIRFRGGCHSKHNSLQAQRNLTSSHDLLPQRMSHVRHRIAVCRECLHVTDELNSRAGERCGESRSELP